MKKIQLYLLLLLTVLSSCHDEPVYKDSMRGNFDALADIIDRHYCFFADKNIDWAEITSQYRSQITEETTIFDLFFLCSQMLDELKDGHVNLSSKFSVSYYRNWWSDYPQDFDLRTLEEYYLDFNWMSASGIIYKQLPGEIAYIYYPSFATIISETTLDYILALMANSRGLIIDIRDNGGGALTNINTLVGRFIEKKTTGAYLMHKTGPGHDDFSEPYPIEYEPSYGHIGWRGDIVVLTNRSCFSAANTFVAVMKDLPNVKIVGAKTGGGGGMPFTSELPIGWGIRFSACPILDSGKNNIEYGIDPSPGCEVHSPAEELAEGKDAILDFAIDLLKDNPLPFPPADPDTNPDDGNPEAGQGNPPFVIID
ncbi:MAG: S41 family peptidase [Muribaculaceae bacterium]|nr:S41 family peptidase [Muribaculaceae bacterium]